MYTSHAFSPVVEAGTVIFHVGGHDQGALTAYDIDSGEVKWELGRRWSGYGSPIVADFGGVRQVVTVTQAKVVGVEGRHGALLWERPFASPQFHQLDDAGAPRPVDHHLEQHGAMTALNIARQEDRWVVETAWESQDVPNRMSNAVLDGDVMFGLTQRNLGQYFALDARTGKLLWTSDGRQATNIAMLRAGNVLFSSRLTASLSLCGRAGPDSNHCTATRSPRPRPGRSRPSPATGSSSRTCRPSRSGR